MCRSNYIHFKGCDEDSPYGPPIMCKEFQINRAMLEEWEDRTGQVSVGQEPTSCPQYRKAILRELEGDCPSCQQHVLNQRERDTCEEARISAARGILQSGLDTSARQTPSGGRENPELRAAVRQFNNYAAIFALAPFHLARYTQEEADVVFGE